MGWLLLEQIDWEAITLENESNAVKSRKTNLIQKDEHNGCPSINSCPKCDPKYCWNNMHCQKFDRTHNGKLKYLVLRSYKPKFVTINYSFIIISIYSSAQAMKKWYYWGNTH